VFFVLCGGRAGARQVWACRSVALGGVVLALYIGCYLLAAKYTYQGAPAAGMPWTCLRQKSIPVPALLLRICIHQRPCHHGSSSLPPFPLSPPRPSFAPSAPCVTVTSTNVTVVSAGGKNVTNIQIISAASTEPPQTPGEATPVLRLLAALAATQGPRHPHRGRGASEPSQGGKEGAGQANGGVDRHTGKRGLHPATPPHKPHRPHGQGTVPGGQASDRDRPDGPDGGDIPGPGRLNHRRLPVAGEGGNATVVSDR
jgi:hypothetical protein